MSIDINQKAYDLLEKLANSIYDRKSENNVPFNFGTAEIRIVEQFLLDYEKEARNQMAEY